MEDAWFKASSYIVINAVHICIESILHLDRGFSLTMARHPGALRFFPALSSSRRFFLGPQLRRVGPRDQDGPGTG